MADTNLFTELISELTGLAIQGAQQSTAIANFLIAKGLATQEELDEYMRLSAEVTEKLQTLARQIPERSQQKSSS